MRAVTGTITSRETATIKQASKVISKFRKAIENGARRDVAAYLSRTCAAVQDLYLFHRELREKMEQQKQEASVENGKISSHAAKVNEERKMEEEKEKKRKKKRSREVKLENGVAVGEIEHGSDKREKKKKKIKIEE